MGELAILDPFRILERSHNPKYPLQSKEPLLYQKCCWISQPLQITAPQADDFCVAQVHSGSLSQKVFYHEELKHDGLDAFKHTH